MTLDISEPPATLTLSEENPFSRKKLFELSLFSTAIFITAALLAQFLITLQTALLLNHFSIHYIYSPFGIIYPSGGPGNWTENRILFVYGAALMIWFIAGLLLTRIKTENWKINLALTWLSFILVCTFPVGILAGAFFYDDFGIAGTWLFRSFGLQLCIAVFASLAMIFTAPYWSKRFLKTASSARFFSDYQKRKRYLKIAVIIPWLIGTFILTAFGIPKHLWYWLAFLAGIGPILLVVYLIRIPKNELKIHRSKKPIFPFAYPLIFVIVMVAMLWLISLYSITF
jgi:hypothetical protein